MSIGRVVVMGGALTVPGNVSAGAEANMASDPEAADAVLRSGRKLTMVGLDVTHRVVLTRRDIAGWTGSGTMAGCAFASMVEHYIGSYEMNAPYLGAARCTIRLPSPWRLTPRSWARSAVTCASTCSASIAAAPSAMSAVWPTPTRAHSWR